MTSQNQRSVKKVFYPKMIAFFGPDGAGKSTQAELLVSLLRARGFKVKKAWIRSPHTFAYILWMIFYRLNLCEDRSGFLKKMRPGFAVSSVRYGRVTSITMSPPRLKGKLSRFIWSVVEIFSIFPVVVLQVYLPLLLGRSVVAERFMVDSVASIAYFLGAEDFANSWQAKILLSLTPKGTVYVYVDADFDAILKRRGILAGAREYTEFHRRLYTKLSKKVGAFYVDTSKDSVAVAEEKISAFVFRQRK